MKLLIRFFLSLCILLLSSYSQPHAQAHQAAMSYSSKKLLEKPVSVHFSALQHQLSVIIKPAPPEKRKAEDKIRATDEKEDDNFVPLKKYLEISSFFFTVFGFQIREFLWMQIRKLLAFCKHLSYFLPHGRYLILQVIRL